MRPAGKASQRRRTFPASLNSVSNDCAHPGPHSCPVGFAREPRDLHDFCDLALARVREHARADCFGLRIVSRDRRDWLNEHARAGYCFVSFVQLRAPQPMQSTA